MSFFVSISYSAAAYILLTPRLKLLRSKMKTVVLAQNLTPTDSKEVEKYRKEISKDLLKRYAQSMEKKSASEQKSDDTVVRDNVQERVVTLGSEETVYTYGDCGLFTAVLAAYNNHWKLRTSPDDWWFCVTRRVAIAIDKNSRKQCVREMFVSHEGK